MFAALFFCSAAVLGTAQEVERVLEAPEVVAAMRVVEANHEWCIETLIELTEIPAPPFGETARGEALMARFRELGLEKVWRDDEGNVFGERPGVGDGPTLVLSAHLDTVFPEGTDVHVRREGMELTAPGIGDNGVGLATLLTVLKALEQAEVRTRGTVIFMGSVGEEGLGDLRGMKHLFQEDHPLRERIDVFVSVDGTRDSSITHKALASRRYRVTYRGPGGHSWSAFGTPNPAFALGRTLARLADLEVPDSPKTSYNVGVIGGGTSVNSIPFEAWMEIDLRGEDTSLLEETERHFLDFVDSGVREENEARSLPGEVTADKELIGDRPAGEIPEDSDLVRTAVEVTRRIVQVNEVALTRGSTDANIPLSLGVPAITVGGGGVGRSSHAPSESFNATHWPRGIRRVLALTVCLVGLP